VSLLRRAAQLGGGIAGAIAEAKAGAGLAVAVAGGIAALAGNNDSQTVLVPVTSTPADRIWAGQQVIRPYHYRQLTML
jgi:phosphoribosylcarboxyaminoimidazole (NCAIR) mutase